MKSSEKEMRIALIRRVSITGFDGVNRFIALLAEGLARLGHEPVIISLCHDDTKNRELSKWFKEAHGLDLEIPIYTLRRECGGSWLSITWDWWQKGSRLLRKKGVDLAIVNGVIPLRFGPKIIVNHGVFMAGGLYRWAAKLLYRRYDAVICVSNKLRSEVKSTLGVDCRVIPLPMKLDLYKPASPGRENVIVHIGTSPIKNPQISIEAVKILKRRGYKVKLVIIGRPSDTPSNEIVEFRGLLPPVSIPSILCRSKALLLPSTYEALPYVTLEAMACGTPPVVSTAVPEEVVIDGYNGLRVHGLDPRDYAAALERLLTDQELWLKLSRNGREFVKQFNYIEIANKYINLIKNLYGR